MRHGLNLVASVESADENDPGNGSGLAIESDQGEQSQQRSANQGSLLIDKSFVPADLRYPAD